MELQDATYRSGVGGSQRGLQRRIPRGARILVGSQPIERTVVHLPERVLDQLLAVEPEPACSQI